MMEGDYCYGEADYLRPELGMAVEKINIASEIQYVRYIGLVRTFYYKNVENSCASISRALAPGVFPRTCGSRLSLSPPLRASISGCL